MARPFLCACKASWCFFGSERVLSLGDNGTLLAVGWRWCSRAPLKYKTMMLIALRTPRSGIENKRRSVGRGSDWSGRDFFGCPYDEERTQRSMHVGVRCLTARPRVIVEFGTRE
ncbi:unnamed protein product, partial [Ectocarpus sp. 8 AP-2014]